MIFLILAITGLGVVSLSSFLYWQGAQTPDVSGEYVALGSSFSAGIGLGPRIAGSPVHCFRTAGGYPALVAQKAELRLVDMSCSGSTTKHILSGGQLLLGPQLAAIGPATKLVTITSGGNDVGYIGDLMAASGNMGWFGAWWHGDIKSADARPYDVVTANLNAIITSVRQTAPSAKILIVNYPAIIPPIGSCAALGISKAQAAISRDLAQQLALATKRAADETGAQLVDIAKASIGHDVCSKMPWVNGASVQTGTAFHPNAVGAAATADLVIKAYSMRATNGSAL
ncbi:SGNH/GDSL hydrolase family protein [Sphingorhabdus sp.]|jgi:lysophospholipase L1-like esterase|uniref:SGNH/GDSL hydrolase family protein n=1 Tax=Sphingorhabdus sp. TaxID=1902408 RepID=UPI0037CBF860